jgi:DNA-directed RNA polymerase subunit K/omega
MQVFTPLDIAKHAANKYLGVLIAAKYARVLNEATLGRASQRAKKLPPQSLEDLSSGRIQYKVQPRRRPGE